MTDSLRTSFANPHVRSCRSILAASLGLFALLLAGEAAAQDNKGDLPPEERLELISGDGVVLAASFYPGTAGPDSVPIMIVHDYKGQRRQYHELALSLQKKGYAVLVPDLRGHGESTQVQRAGATRELSADQMNPRDLARIVVDDLETMKKFLVSKNNEKQLNIDKLCVIGSGLGALLCTQWTARDWSWPRLATGKQGQDVKALVMITPMQRFKTLRIDDALDHPSLRSEVAVMIAIGREDKGARDDAIRIFNRLKRFHNDDDALVTKGYETSLQGDKLLGEGFGVDQDIAAFIESQVASKSYPWQDRPSPVP